MKGWEGKERKEECLREVKERSKGRESGGGVDI